DLFVTYARRTLSFLNPFEAVNMLQQRGLATADKGDEASMCGWVDALTETALKAMQRASTTLAINAINSLSSIMARYLTTCRSREASVTAPTDSTPSHDKVRYTLFYLFDRLQMLYDTAIQQRLEAVCSPVITLLGHVSIAAAKYDLSFGVY